MILNFEAWYAEEFEQAAQGTLMDETYNQTLKQHYQQVSTYKGESMNMGLGEEEVDEDAMAFIRAKKKVDTLHKAKKLERTARK